MFYLTLIVNSMISSTRSVILQRLGSTLCTITVILFFPFTVKAQVNSNKISLSGEWNFKPDPLDIGIRENWYKRTLEEKVQLPGSMATNLKGDNISLTTPWTGQILDSSYFKKPEYAKYREVGNIKIPFWLQPVKYYKGAAWYQKKITIRQNTKPRNAELFLERSHWESTAWIDGKKLGMRNSLSVPHIFNLGKLATGTHIITVRVDNRIKEFNVGPNSHSISDHTQTNWNGLIGELSVRFKPDINISEIKLFPDPNNKLVITKLTIENTLKKQIKATLNLLALGPPNSASLNTLSKSVILKAGSNEIEISYPIVKPKLWDEFHPNLYMMEATINQDLLSKRTAVFGIRKFSADSTQFTINGRKIFLRGTLECAIFPKTGYPPTDERDWEKIFKKCKEYGLNHIRFHSWCPPEAAFNVADRMGFYLQVECASWANLNRNVGIGQGLGIDKYIYDESNRIVSTYGNHPSFVMMAYGNEPSGPGYKEYLTKFVDYWKKKDNRRLYTTGAGWPVMPGSDFNSSPDPRIQRWGEGLKSIINSQQPSTDYDWSNIISKWQGPTVSHEIGQWCVYPDFKEIKEYDGILKAKNFEIFHDKLEVNGLSSLADSFLLASGKLQVLCYKADIEAALRTPGFGGFQLLDLHDFPGQGTALVGVLNAFWEEKGYVTGKEYSRFCNSTVPLARFPKMVFLNNEELIVPVEVAHFGEAKLSHVTPMWSIKNQQGQIIFSGKLHTTDIQIGNGIKLGKIYQQLSSIKTAGQFKVSVTIGENENSWDIFIYPAILPPADENILIVQRLSEEAIKALNEGKNVLLSCKKDEITKQAGGDVKIGFSSIFWNTAWTSGQAPTTLGILCNPNHKALQYFPTEYHSNWQWHDAMTHSNAIRLDSVAVGLKPIVRVIDDWFTANSLGLIFECKIGKGKLLFSSIDLLTDKEKRPEATQLLYSLKNYMNSSAFDPTISVKLEKISSLFK